MRCRAPRRLEHDTGEIDRRPHIPRPHRQADLFQGRRGAGRRRCGDAAVLIAVGHPDLGPRARHHDEFADANRQRAQHTTGDRRTLDDLEPGACHRDDRVHGRVLRQMNADAIDGDELHDKRLLRGVVDQFQVVAQAGRCIGQPPDLAVRIGDADGRKLLAVDGVEPAPAGVVVAWILILRVVGPGTPAARGLLSRSRETGCRNPGPAG